MAVVARIVTKFAAFFKEAWHIAKKFRSNSALEKTTLPYRVLLYYLQLCFYLEGVGRSDLPRIRTSSSCAFRYSFSSCPGDLGFRTFHVRCIFLAWEHFLFSGGLRHSDPSHSRHSMRYSNDCFWPIPGLHENRAKIITAAIRDINELRARQATLTAKIPFGCAHAHLIIRGCRDGRIFERPLFLCILRNMFSPLFCSFSNTNFRVTSINFCVSRRVKLKTYL